MHILTDRGREHKGIIEYYSYELYLSIESIEHTTSKAYSPRSSKWRAFPKEFVIGIPPRDEPLGKKGILDRIFTLLQEKGIIKMKLEVIYLDSTSIKVHPHGRETLKKMDPNALAGHLGDGQPSFIWLPRMPKQG